MLCETIFNETISKSNEGRYIVDLPLKSNIGSLGSSQEIALHRFYSLEKRLEKNQELKERYTNFMKEYESLNHMEAVDDAILKEQTYFIPHHCVVKNESTTTKLRVVFDASCKTDTGISLNQCLMVGPVVQEDLFSIVVRFRKHTFAMTADVEKMYRQVLVNPIHRRLQLIYWRDNPNLPIKIFQLNTITYGTASAPYLATRTLQQLALDNKENFPQAAEATIRDFYVDDILTGADSKEKAKLLQKQLIKLLSLGGFNLRKWSANDPSLLSHLSPDDCETNSEYHLNQDNTIKTLGLFWNYKDDSFRFKVNLNSHNNLISKRSILSEVARIFDPLGLIGPVILKAKIILQELWKLKLNWDESIPLHIHNQWIQLRTSLLELNKLLIPRCIIAQNSIKTELHSFSDASESGYGACIYLRTEDSKHFVQVKLICSKSRVAPLKAISLPRLELCGAVLAAKLAHKVDSALKLNISNKYFWTDSKVVLSWIGSVSTNWSVFVANRIAKIQRLTNIEEWRHVQSVDNPADMLSRGMLANQLIQSECWWSGPDWLTHYSNWNKAMNVPLPSIEELPEHKSKIHALVVIEQNKAIYKYSSFRKLQRVVAYMFRFRNNTRQKDPNVRELGPLTVLELKSSMLNIIKLIQAEHFELEIKQLQNKQQLNLQGKLLSLHPFVDKYHILRVGGRLQHSDLPYTQKHPILLPEKNPITKLIMEQEHIRLLHAGPQALLASVRQLFWPLNGRKLARRVVNDCIICFRNKPKSSQQLMGELPSSRVQPSRPFLQVGVDYCGPIQLISSHRRGAKTSKGFIALFICMCTRAIHIELVQDLTTQSFLAALQRFMSRRGKCAQIFSDNASNFVGAKNELKALYSLLSSQKHQSQVINSMTSDNIKWNFIPPRSPNFGGLWEAGVKSVKHHLRRIVGQTFLTYEELITVLCKIEGCLNSRPLTPLSSDPSDLSPLTPGHFLIGEPLTNIPEEDITEMASGRLSRWQRITQLSQHFWQRWQREYITEHQMRAKWKSPTPNVKVGTLVVLREGNLPPLQWKMGRILDTFPGSDGRVRVVSVRTAGGQVLKRSITQLCPLPIEE